MSTKVTCLLKGSHSIIGVYENVHTNTYSIAIIEKAEPRIKFISKELYEMLLKELEYQVGV